MRKNILMTISFLFLSPFAYAQSPLEGLWCSLESGQSIKLTQFGSNLTGSTRSFYSDGSPSDYFFSFILPQAPIQPNQIIKGTIRSVDGYYGCLFDQPAELMMASNREIKIRFPLLTFHLRTESVRNPDADGYTSSRQVDWTGWGWIESVSYFPIQAWRVTSKECIIDQVNWINKSLIR